MILRDLFFEKREQVFVHKQTHQNVKGEVSIFKIAVKGRRNVIHSLTILNFRNYISNVGQNCIQVLYLIFREGCSGDRVFSPFKI